MVSNIVMQHFSHATESWISRAPFVDPDSFTGVSHGNRLGLQECHVIKEKVDYHNVGKESNPEKDTSKKVSRAI